MKADRALARRRGARGAGWSLACGLVLGAMLAPAWAEDRDARLRDMAQRVAVLATSWEPDLEAAMQGLVEEFGPGLTESQGWPPINSAESHDPMWAKLVYTGLRPDLGTPLADFEAPAFFFATCFRMGQPTIVAKLATYDFEPGKPVTWIGGEPLGLVESFSSEIRVLRSCQMPVLRRICRR